MSITIQPMLGWKIDNVDDLGYLVPAVTHPEKRFDPKTGKRLADIQVVDTPERRVIRTPDGEFDMSEIKWDKNIEKALNKMGIMIFAGDGEYNPAIYLGVNLPCAREREHGGMIDVRESLDLSQLRAPLPTVLNLTADAILQAFNYRVDVNDVKIWVAWYASF